MKKIKFIFSSLLLTTAVSLSAQVGQVNQNVYGSRVKDQINAAITQSNSNKAGIDSVRNGQLGVTTDSILLAFTTDGVTGIIWKDTIPWLHDYPGTNAGGGTTTADITATRGKNLAIGKWALSQFPTGLSTNEGTMNIAIGDSTLVENITGHANTAVGNAALRSNVGSLNTAVGRQALYLYEQTGLGNSTAVGESALERVRTGQNNTAVGTNASMFLINGGYNTAIGANAGYGHSADLVHGLSTYTYATAVGNSAYGSANTGVGNVAIGALAMGGQDSTGSYSVAVGYNALNMNKESWNVGIGERVAENDTVGFMSTYVGRYAGRLAEGSIRNVIIGANAASAAVFEGDESVIIGAYAGEDLTTGDNNTIIGRSAGNTLTTGSGNVFLGYSAGYYETGSNKLMIDNVPRASEAAARDSALVYGEFATNSVDQLVTLNAVLKLKPLAEPPDSPEEGMIYADTDHHLYYYNGSGWVQLDN